MRRAVRLRCTRALVWPPAALGQTDARGRLKQDLPGDGEGAGRAPEPERAHWGGCLRECEPQGM